MATSRDHSKKVQHQECVEDKKNKRNIADIQTSILNRKSNLIRDISIYTKESNAYTNNIDQNKDIDVVVHFQKKRLEQKNKRALTRKFLEYATSHRLNISPYTTLEKEQYIAQDYKELKLKYDKSMTNKNVWHESFDSFYRKYKKAIVPRWHQEFSKFVRLPQGKLKTSPVLVINRLEIYNTKILPKIVSDINGKILNPAFIRAKTYSNYVDIHNGLSGLYKTYALPLWSKVDFDYIRKHYKKTMYDQLNEYKAFGSMKEYKEFESKFVETEFNRVKKKKKVAPYLRAAFMSAEKRKILKRMDHFQLITNDSEAYNRYANLYIKHANRNQKRGELRLTQGLFASVRDQYRPKPGLKRRKGKDVKIMQDTTRNITKEYELDSFLRRHVKYILKVSELSSDMTVDYGSYVDVEKKPKGFYQFVMNGYKTFARSNVVNIRRVYMDTISKPLDVLPSNTEMLIAIWNKHEDGFKIKYMLKGLIQEFNKSFDAMCSDRMKFHIDRLYSSVSTPTIRIYLQEYIQHPDIVYEAFFKQWRKRYPIHMNDSTTFIDADLEYDRKLRKERKLETDKFFNLWKTKLVAIANSLHNSTNEEKQVLREAKKELASLVLHKPLLSLERELFNTLLTITEANRIDVMQAIKALHDKSLVMDRRLYLESERLLFDLFFSITKKNYKDKLDYIRNVYRINIRHGNKKEKQTLDDRNKINIFDGMLHIIHRIYTTANPEKKEMKKRYDEIDQICDSGQPLTFDNIITFNMLSVTNEIDEKKVWIYLKRFQTIEKIVHANKPREKHNRDIQWQSMSIKYRLKMLKRYMSKTHIDKKKSNASDLDSEYIKERELDIMGRVVDNRGNTSTTRLQTVTSFGAIIPFLKQNGDKTEIYYIMEDGTEHSRWGWTVDNEWGYLKIIDWKDKGATVTGTREEWVTALGRQIAASDSKERKAFLEKRLKNYLEIAGTTGNRVQKTNHKIKYSYDQDNVESFGTREKRRLVELNTKLGKTRDPKLKQELVHQIRKIKEYVPPEEFELKKCANLLCVDGSNIRKSLSDFRVLNKDGTIEYTTLCKKCHGKIPMHIYTTIRTLLHKSGKVDTKSGLSKYDMYENITPDDITAILVQTPELSTYKQYLYVIHTRITGQHKNDAKYRESMRLNTCIKLISNVFSAIANKTFVFGTESKDFYYFSTKSDNVVIGPIPTVDYSIYSPFMKIIKHQLSKAQDPIIDTVELLAPAFIMLGTVYRELIYNQAYNPNHIFSNPYVFSPYKDKIISINETLLDVRTSLAKSIQNNAVLLTHIYDIKRDFTDDFTEPGHPDGRFVEYSKEIDGKMCTIKQSVQEIVRISKDVKPVELFIEKQVQDTTPSDDVVPAPSGDIDDLIDRLTDAVIAEAGDKKKPKQEIIHEWKQIHGFQPSSTSFTDTHNARDSKSKPTTSETLLSKLDTLVHDKHQRKVEKKVVVKLPETCDIMRKHIQKIHGQCDWRKVDTTQEKKPNKRTLLELLSKQFLVLAGKKLIPFNMNDVSSTDNDSIANNGDIKDQKYAKIVSTLDKKTDDFKIDEPIMVTMVDVDGHMIESTEPATISGHENDGQWSIKYDDESKDAVTVSNYIVPKNDTGNDCNMCKQSKKFKSIVKIDNEYNHVYFCSLKCFESSSVF